jgi:hypothetical protein
LHEEAMDRKTAIQVVTTYELGGKVVYEVRRKSVENGVESEALIWCKSLSGRWSAAKWRRRYLYEREQAEIAEREFVLAKHAGPAGSGRQSKS